MDQQVQTLQEEKEKKEEKSTATITTNATILPEYEQMYQQNNDLVGWLSIPDTTIDYPVMQTPAEEDYYLTHGFDKKENANGCLILDTESKAGMGTPSTNLIIHGHHMKSGEMFGNLEKYMDEDYAKQHRVIEFDTLYEKRQYEVVAVFLSQVYKKSDQVFKYYKFIEASNENQFNDFYSHIKELSLFDTGVTAEFGDEFITLSTCAYHVENGRLVVVGKRLSP